MSVTLHIDGHSVEAPVGATIFDCAEKIGVHVPTSCHKQGKCRECLVEVVEGRELLADPTPEELHLSGHFRLSCRAKITASEGELRCHTMRRGRIRVLERLAALPGQPADDRFDPAVRRDGDRILLDGTNIATSTGPIHGLAIDLGTTTVVVNLVDLESGKITATTSFENPQRFGGSNVMARIAYDCDHPGKLLQRTLLGYLGHAIESLPCDNKSIYEIVVAGNTTMRDLFFGLNVHSVGQSPFRSLTEYELLEGKRETTALSVTAKSLRLPIHPAGRVYSLPLIACHVGADTAACLLAIGLARQEKLVAMMDIGTNTELVVGNKDRILAASCPAGPAFEGNGIDAGMPALDGAIERVHIADNGCLQLGIIGPPEGYPEGPQGICGSGLVDILSELRRTGRMTHTGRFTNHEQFLALDPAGLVRFNELDASLLAQAKGANVAGIRIVMKHYGIEMSDLHQFYLAGGFAHHLDLDAARRIGMVPNLGDDKLIQIGNAAIEGATIALRSVSARREIERLCRGIKHIELETDPAFFDLFVQGCLFEPV